MCLRSIINQSVLTIKWIELNTLRPRQNGRDIADDILKCIFFRENIWISITVSLNFVPRCPINNIPALVQIMDWRRPGDKPLSEPMVVTLLTHICVIRLQWVKPILCLLSSCRRYAFLTPDTFFYLYCKRFCLWRISTIDAFYISLYCFNTGAAHC